MGTILRGPSKKDIQRLGKYAESAVPPTRIVTIGMRDGVKIAAAIYLPKGAGRFPALLAASPYRFDNDIAPALPMFLWRETGPIGWYLELGYAFVHMDVRGTGRSGGNYRYMCRKEQRDLCEVIEWIARQKWSNGRVGGIGQSYYARMQWFMAIQNPPHLACVAPYDGNVDTYRSSAYTGGIPGEFPVTWYRGVRLLNQDPACGPSRLVEWDYPRAVRAHPIYDAFWRERAAAPNLHRIRVPVFSIGVWRKVDLHLNGNIVGFQRSGGPKKLLVFGSANVHAAVQDYSSIAFHERYLLPFYDRYLKDKQTGYEAEPAVRWFASGATEMRAADAWPPEDIAYRTYYLARARSGGPAGSVTSLNNGELGEDAPQTDSDSTSYDYPDPGWRMGVVGTGPDGRPDPARRGRTLWSGAVPAAAAKDQGLAARIAPEHRSGAEHRARASLRARPSAADCAGEGIPVRDRADAHRAPLRARQLRPPGACQRRFLGDGVRVRARVFPRQDRQGYDFPRPAPSFAARAAGAPIAQPGEAGTNQACSILLFMISRNR